MGFFIHVRAKLESAVPCPWLEISMRLGGTTKKQGGARPFPNSMNGFDDCIDQCGSEEFSLEGLTFTRTNSSSGDARIDCRLDRVLFNTSFLNSASNFNGKLLNAGLSDHHAILITESSRPKVKAPFRHFHAWAREKDFFKIVKEAWDVHIEGKPIFVLVRKLKFVKKALSACQRSRPRISYRVQAARDELDRIQALISVGDVDPGLLFAEKEAKEVLSDRILVEAKHAQAKSQRQASERRRLQF